MKFFREKTIEYKIALFLSLMTFMVVSIITSYSDMQSLTMWTINIWDNLFETGNPLNFYAYSAQNIHNLPHIYVGSDILIYIPWAIWNLPLWLLQRFGGLIAVEHQFMMVWSKCFLILLVAGCAGVIKKIAGLLNSGYGEECIFLFLTGFYTLTSVGFIGQNDIQVIFVLLLAMEAYLSNDWKKFLLWSALSIAFKPYFLFPYVALVLLKEKRVLHIVLYGLSGISIYMLQKIPFLNAPMYKESLANGPTNAVVFRMLENVINFTPHMVSLFVLSLLVVYVLAYFDDMEEGDNQKGIYYGMMSYICFFLFVRYESYRPLYLFVFLYLMILVKPMYYRVYLWLETIITACFMYYYLYFGQCFCDGQFYVLPFTAESTISLSELVKSIIATPYVTVCMAVLLLCMVVYGVISHPRFCAKSVALHMKVEPWLIVLRSCLFVAPYLLAIVLRYV